MMSSFFFHSTVHIYDWLWTFFCTLELWCITATPFSTYHGLLKVNRAKTTARDGEDIGWLSHSCCLWHPHEMVLSVGRDNPICLCQMPNGVLMTNDWELI